MQCEDSTAPLVFFLFSLPEKAYFPGHFLLSQSLSFSVSLSLAFSPQASSRKTISFVPIDPLRRHLCSQFKVWKGRLK